MQDEDENRPVTHIYLKEVLSRVDQSLQQYSQDIIEIKRYQSSKPDNKLLNIERRVEEISRQIRDTLNDERRDDYSQKTLQQQLSDIERRLDKLEHLEKNEEYDQNTLENDVRQLKNDFSNIERRLKDIDYKLRKL